ncbi:hypothetical protein Tco_0532098 [Tanacetum coccineum]
MSSDNASSAVTYTSVSSDSNRPSSWGIPLENAGELPKMDPYEELDEHVPVYIPEPEHPEYHAPSDDDIQIEDQPYADDASPTAESPGYIADSDTIEEDTDEDSINYPDEPGTDDEDPKEDPSEEHEPEDEDAKEDEPSEDSDETKPFEENETAATPPPPRSPQTRVPFSQTRLRRARKTVRPEPPMPASMEARIAEHAATPIPPTSPTYDQAPLGHRAAMIRMRDDIPEEDMPPWRRFILTAPPLGCDIAKSSAAAAARAPRGQYDFVDVVEAEQGLIRSPGHDARTIARAADRAEDVGYVRALQSSEHRMMTSIKEVNLRVSYQAQVRRQESEIFYTQLHDARTDRRDIRLEIYVVRGMDKAKITRKRLKPGKHEHKNERAHKKPEGRYLRAEKTIQGVKYMVAELNIIHKPSLVNSIKGMTHRQEESIRECGIYTRSTLRRSTKVSQSRISTLAICMKQSNPTA